MFDRDDKEIVFNLGDKLEVLLEKVDMFNLEIVVSPTSL